MTNTPPIYGPHLSFSPLFHPTACAGRLSHSPATSLQSLTQASWLSSGPCSWHGVSAIGNAYATVSDANDNTNWHRYYCPPSVAALATPSPAVAAPAFELVILATAPGSNNLPQVFYTVQEIEAHSLEDLELTRCTTSRKGYVYPEPSSASYCECTSLC